MESTTTLPLFVYGTLRRGGRYHDDYLAGRFDRVRPAILPDYRKIVGTHGFDVAEPAPGESVAGELFELSPGDYQSTMVRCDELEELPPGQLQGDLYRRIVVSVECDGQMLAAWLYAAP